MRRTSEPGDSHRKEDGRAHAFDCTAEGTAFHEQHSWMFRWPPLLYTLFWIVNTAQDRKPHSWWGLALFYAVFLLAYLRMFSAGERHPKFWLGVMFVLGYVYFQLNHNAAGEFVFPVVMCTLFLQNPKLSIALWQLGLVELVGASGVLIETKLTHAHPALAQEIIFYMLAIGVTNFAYSRHVMASEMLACANREIEHLAKVAERERIARDLHDLLGHTLTVIVLKSDAANRLFHLEPELAHREIAEVEATARMALAEVREAVSGYRAEGLPAELARARRALTSAGVQLITTEIEPMALDGAETNVLCLVLRESVTNVIRHARATMCRVELHRDTDRVRMAVEDNGQGTTAPDGNGLRGMRERVMAAGGSLSREAAGAGGTRVVAELPVGDRASQVVRVKDLDEGALREMGPAEGMVRA